MLAPSTMIHPFEAKESALQVVKSGGGGEGGTVDGNGGRQRVNVYGRALEEEA